MVKTHEFPSLIGRNIQNPQFNFGVKLCKRSRVWSIGTMDGWVWGGLTPPKLPFSMKGGGEGVGNLKPHRIKGNC